MRFSNALVSVLTLSGPLLSLAAPIHPNHYQELEARWNKAQVKQFASKVGNGFLQAAKVAVPIALTVAPMFMKGKGAKRDHIPELEERDFADEDVEDLHRRAISQGAKNFWKHVGSGALTTVKTLGPAAAEIVAMNRGWIAKRSDGTDLHLVERDRMLFELSERDEIPFELEERDFIDMEELERRGISPGARKFFHGAKEVGKEAFIEYGPLALKAIAHGVSGGRY